MNFLTNSFNEIFVEVFDEFLFFYPLRALGSEYLRSCLLLDGSKGQLPSGGHFTPPQFMKYYLKLFYLFRVMSGNLALC